MRRIRHCAPRFAGAALLVSMLCTGSAEALSIVNQDLLLESGAAVITVNNSTGAVTWRLRDLDGTIVTTGTASGSSGTIDLSSVAPGYYALELGSWSGTINTNVGIIANLSTVPSTATAKFGTTAHPERLPSPNYANLLAKAGLAYLRFDMYWPQIEPTAGNYTFAPTTPYYINYDTLISSLTAAGITPLAVLGYSNPAYDNNKRPYDAAGFAAYANYAAAIAGHFGARLQYEIYNEYNAPYTYSPPECGPAVSCYMPMLEAARTAILAQAPSAKVVLTGVAGLTPTWLGGAPPAQAAAYDFISYNWLQTFLDDGGAGYVDAFNIHNYTIDYSTGSLVYVAPEGANEQIIQNVKALLAQYPAALGKPLWLTETGWTNYLPGGVSETVQAAYLVRDAVLTLRQGLDRYQFYDLFDDTSYPTPDGNWGMLRNPQYYPNIAPKPSFVAEAVLTRKLDGYSYSSSDNLGANLYSLVFTKSGSPDLRVLWTTNPNATGVDVSATSAFTVTSNLGTPSTVTPSSGTGVIPLTGNPVYVSDGSVRGVTQHSPVNPSGGADLAVGKSVVASSQSGSYVAANAVDTSTETIWQSASLPATLTVDMGANYDVYQARVTLPADWGLWRRETITVLGSTDGITFSPISAATSYPFTNTNSNSVIIKLPVTTARYLRLLVTANNLSVSAQIGQVQIYGL